MKTLRRLNSSAPVGPPAVLLRQDRIGREQRREHDHVAEDEDPEPISDDDALRGRPAAAQPAREFGWNHGWSSIDCVDCHAGCLTSSGPFHLRNFGGRDFVFTLDAPAGSQHHDDCGDQKLRIASHQMCQISEKPKERRQEAVTKPTGLLRAYRSLRMPVRAGSCPVRFCPTTSRSSQVWARREIITAGERRLTIPACGRSTGRR